MEGQMSLFSGNNAEDKGFTVIEGGNTVTDGIKCFQSELKEVDYLTREELFAGFNKIKAITFSYDVGFISTIMEQFEYGEILLGADFLVEKDEKLQGMLVEIYTSAYEAGVAVRSCKTLMKMLKDEKVEIRTPLFVMDHRKIYLLSSDSGKTRVIRTSANMTGRAWNGEHMEFYEYDDTAYCYEEYEKEFETAWMNSQEIPYSVVSSKKAEDKVEGNPIIKKVKETGQTIVLQEPSGNIEFEKVKYVIDYQTIREEYKQLLNGISTKGKQGFVEINPKTIEKIEHNKKKMLQQKAQYKEKTQGYPELSFDYVDMKAFLNGEELDLYPEKNDVCKDIDQLLEMFGNFDQFVFTRGKLKERHFKMLNAMFVSPFNAKVRCTAYIMGIGTTSLPMFLLAASTMANCGKTFTIRAILKMMTGMDLPVMNKENCKKEDVRNCQFGCKGIPVFIDELDNRYKSNIMDILKNPEKCEENQLEEQPMIVFASNDVVEPDEILRKRIVFIRFEGGLPSSIDQSAYKGKGNAIIRRLGTAFYRKYLGKMLVRVKWELDYMIHDKNIPDTYYPDLMKISSTVIMEIFKEYGYEIPSYIKVLTWNDDYSVNASCISDNTMSEIEELLKTNPKSFTITKSQVTIELGSDKNSQKQMASWKNTLPPEMKAEFTSTKDCSKITINREELERRLGFKFTKLGIIIRRHSS